MSNRALDGPVMILTRFAKQSLALPEIKEYSEWKLELSGPALLSAAFLGRIENLLEHA